MFTTLTAITAYKAWLLLLCTLIVMTSSVLANKYNSVALHFNQHPGYEDLSQSEKNNFDMSYIAPYYGRHGHFAKQMPNVLKFKSGNTPFSMDYRRTYNTNMQLASTFNNITCQYIADNFVNLIDRNLPAAKCNYENRILVAEHCHKYATAQIKDKRYLLTSGKVDGRILGDMLDKFTNPDIDDDKTINILMLGNSFTQGGKERRTLHLKDMLYRMIRSQPRSKVKSIQVAKVTHGGWTLGAHSQNPESTKTIKSQKWDAIILQEQSMFLSLNNNFIYVQSYQAAKRLVAASRLTIDGYELSTTQKFYLYNTWGYKHGNGPNDNFYKMQDRLKAGAIYLTDMLNKYHNASIDIIPAGETWRDVTKKDVNKEKLWLQDGRHPAEHGRYATALTMYYKLFGENAPNKYKPRSISRNKEREYQASAKKAVKNFKAKP